MNNKMIVLEQLPIIKYKLEQLSVEIKEKVDKVNSLIVNEETVKETKQLRAELNKEFKELEEQRKEVKNAIMSKYDEFNNIYVENVSNLYKDADEQLKQKIDNVENELKQQRKTRMVELFNEYRTANHLEDIIEFEDVRLNITLSASEKSLKDTVITFCEKVAEDIKAINSMEDSTSLLLKYKSNGFDLTKAIYQVNEEKKQREELERKLNIVQEETKKDEIVQEQVEELIVPEIEEEDITITFTVTGKKSDIIKVREFMKENNIKYE